MTSAAIGPRTKAALREVERLETARVQAAEAEAELAQAVAEREEKLNLTRAQGLIGRLDKDQIVAFESELETLRGQLAEKRSTLDGLDHILTNRRAGLEEARVADAKEALTTEEMRVALEGLEANAVALEKTRAAILTTLKRGAKSLVEKLADQRQEWNRLVEGRKALYRQRQKAMGQKASFSEDAYYRMLRDDRVRLFADIQDLSEVLELAEFLRPLLDQRKGK